MISHSQIVTLIIPLMLLATSARAAELTQQPLFQVDRSAGSKVVKYDLQLRADGTPHRKKPVVAYWYRLDSTEPIKQLSWIQRRFAYGFKAELDEATNTVTLDMVADIGRPIVVIPDADAYRATIRVDGANCFLEQMFIASSGSGMGTRVEYIDLRGRDLKTGEERYERITP